MASNLTGLALLLIGQNIRQLLIQEIVIEHLYAGKCIIPGLNKKDKLTGYILLYGVIVYQEMKYIWTIKENCSVDILRTQPL